jgi:hypothetical protein
MTTRHIARITTTDGKLLTSVSSTDPKVVRGEIRKTLKGHPDAKVSRQTRKS